MLKFPQKIKDLTVIDFAKFLDRRPNGLSKWEMRMMDMFLKKYIPFNAPHSFRLMELKKGRAKMTLPYRRKNLNHLRGIHAAALITLGEFCTGLAVASIVGLERYRFIFKRLECDYFYQARSHVYGHCEVNRDDFEEVLDELDEFGKVEISQEAFIKGKNGVDICTVRSVIQLKDWRKVSTPQ